MKIRFLLLAGILGLGMLSACSNDDEVNGNDTNKGESYAQIAINIASTSTTRTVTGNTGDEEFGENYEYNISDVTIVLADAHNIAQKIYHPEMKTATNTDDDDKMIRVTEPFKIPSGKYKVFVLANYDTAKGGLTPIVLAATDMTSDFNITNFTKLKTDDNFFMTNTNIPEETTFSNTATDNEVNDNGSVTSNPQTVHLLQVDIERVVSKVTFTQSDKEFDVKTGNERVATAEIEGVAMINYNKKLHLVKDATQVATDDKKPVAQDKIWYYPHDANYDYVLGKDGETNKDTEWLDANFDKSKANDNDFVTDFNSKFYCPENTMQALSQQNGQTTGVIYKVEYIPDETNGYTKLAESGTDSYSQKFTEILKLENRDESITKTMFDKKEESSDKTFYAYNNLIFASKNAACMYKVIRENPNKAAAELNTEYGTVKGQETADNQVYKYENGICYYSVWIKHNPNSTVAMEEFKYGTVRNHWYDLTVTGIKGLGYYEPTYEKPENPDDAAETNIQVKATIKKWTIVKQNIELQ